jgi:hypothetical protein
MARLSITPTSVVAKYPALPLTANSADFTWTAAGASFADGAGFQMTGKEILLVRNDNVGAQTVTITSVEDKYGRTGNITTYSVGSGEYAAFPQFPKDGWAQADGQLYFAASAADVYFAVLRLP